jgi:hypothetical protein
MASILSLVGAGVFLLPGFGILKDTFIPEHHDVYRKHNSPDARTIERAAKRLGIKIGDEPGRRDNDQT